MSVKMWNPEKTGSKRNKNKINWKNNIRLKQKDDKKTLIN